MNKFINTVSWITDDLDVPVGLEPSQESYNKLISEVNCNSSKNDRLLDQSYSAMLQIENIRKSGLQPGTKLRESHEFGHS